MANGTELLLQQVTDQLLEAIDNKDVAEIQKIDKKIAEVLGHPKFEKHKYEEPLKRLKEVHNQALALVKAEASRVSSAMSSFRDNSEGLRGYFEVSGE